MNWRHDLASLRQRMAAFFGRRRRDRDVDDELAFHLAMRQAEHARAGVSPEESARLARRQFGNVTLIKEQTRDMWTFPSFESMCPRRPLRAANPPPSARLQRRRRCWCWRSASAPTRRCSASSTRCCCAACRIPTPIGSSLLIGNVQRTTRRAARATRYPDHATGARSRRGSTTWPRIRTSRSRLAGNDEPERISVEAVSWPYFSVLGVAPVHGRTFREDEDVPGSDPSSVLSRRPLGPPVRRRTRPSSTRPCSVGGRPFTVIGVMPPGFAGVTRSRAALAAVPHGRHAARQPRQPGFLDGRAAEGRRDDRRGARGAGRDLDAARSRVSGDERRSVASR